jgi:hypothetical protein
VVGEKEGGAESLPLRGGGNLEDNDETMREFEDDGQSVEQGGKEVQVATVAPVRNHF